MADEQSDKPDEKVEAKAQAATEQKSEPKAAPAAAEENKSEPQATTEAPAEAAKLKPEVKKDETSVEEKKKTVPAETSATKADKPKAEVPAEFKKIVEQLDKFSALEISKFVKLLEDHWGVSAAVPVAAATAPATAGGEAATAEAAKSEYDIMLKDPGAQKVAVIKAVKDITGLGLGEAKALVDGAPKVILEKTPQADAEAAKKTLEEAGATVELS